MDTGYFKGWYFKCCNGEKTVAFIPAYHIYNGKKTASLQIITDDAAYNLPFRSLEYRTKPLSVKIGNCFFGEAGIFGKLDSGDVTFDAALSFRSVSPIAYDIMGPFALVPFMQCRHSVYSMAHTVDGHLTLNGRHYDFENGVGYIEGDRGSSFPEKYIWTQCCFENGSLMLSVADIPMLGSCFTGIIGVVMVNGKEHRIATYLGAGIKRIGDRSVTVGQGGYEFTAELLEKNALPLRAPSNGNMSRTIHESASCKAHYRVLHKGRVLCEFFSDKAGFEFEYGC